MLITPCMMLPGATGYIATYQQPAQQQTMLFTPQVTMQLTSSRHSMSAGPDATATDNAAAEMQLLALYEIQVLCKRLPALP